MFYEMTGAAPNEVPTEVGRVLFMTVTDSKLALQSSYNSYSIKNRFLVHQIFNPTS